MQKLPHFVPAFSHHLKPPLRHGSQFTPMRSHPRLDGRIALDSAIESQQLRSHRRSTFCLRDMRLGRIFISLEQAVTPRFVYLCVLSRK
jgi:hypothetical protein